MLNEGWIVDRIERAHGQRPNCDCGRETIVAYRDGTIWLECAAIHEPAGNLVKRFWSAIAAQPHVREAIVALDAPEELAA